MVDRVDPIEDIFSLRIGKGLDLGVGELVPFSRKADPVGTGELKKAGRHAGEKVVEGLALFIGPRQVGLEVREALVQHPESFKQALKGRLRLPPERRGLQFILKFPKEGRIVIDRQRLLKPLADLRVGAGIIRHRAPLIRIESEERLRDEKKGGGQEKALHRAASIAL